MTSLSQENAPKFFFTFVRISESFSLHVIFEYAIASSVEKCVHRIQTQFVLN
jgi:hypothetical protein